MISERRHRRNHLSSDEIRLDSWLNSNWLHSTHQCLNLFKNYHNLLGVIVLRTLGTNGLNENSSEHHFLCLRSFLLYKRSSFMCSSEKQWRTRRCSSSWSVSDRGRWAPGWWWDCASRRPSLEGADLRHSPREAVRDRRGAVRSRAVLFFQFRPFFCVLLAWADLRFTPFNQFIYLSRSAFYHFYPVQVLGQICVLPLSSSSSTWADLRFTTFIQFK